MAFSINSSAAPDYAQPSGKRTRLLRPRNTDLDGLGRPCGAVGKPEAVIGKRIINESGFQWYLSFFADPLDQSVDLTEISLYDALQADWVSFSAATMHTPTWTGGVEGVYYEEFTIKLTGLEE